MLEVNYKKLIRGLIEIHENDFAALEIEDKSEWNLWFLKMIKSFTRIELDIRYCSKRDCSCSPESDITYLLKDLTEDDLNKLIPDMPLSEVSGRWIKSVVWDYKRKELT